MQGNAVRQFTHNDSQAIQDICYATGFMGASADNFWQHKQSLVEIWTTYYMDREASSLLVATKDGQVVAI